MSAMAERWFPVLAAVLGLLVLGLMVAVIVLSETKASY